MERLICELPIEVRNILRSGVVIPNISQCIVELILNALDSAASSIAIRVNLVHHRIQVVDNGCGMDSNTLNFIGLRYMTSKCHSLDDLRKHFSFFGFRGETLASLRNVSKSLVIESRTLESTNTYSKVFNSGKSEDAVVSTTNRASCGTTVTISGFLYNMPVRQKIISEVLDLEEIRTFVEAIALIHPEVAFSLRNEVNGSIILQTSRTYEIEKTFTLLFGATIAESLVRVKHQSDRFKVKGFISRAAQGPKHLQFVYVNKRIVHKTAIHKLVNAMLAKSSILQSERCRNAAISKKKTYGNWLAYSPPPKRDNSAVFMLNIKCAYIEYDISLDSKKSVVEFLDWSSVLKCVTDTVREFLEAEGLVSKPPEEEVVLPISDETETLKMYAELLRRAGCSHDLGRGIRGRTAVRSGTSVETDDKAASAEINAGAMTATTHAPDCPETCKITKETSADKSEDISIPAPDVDHCDDSGTPYSPSSVMSEVEEELSPIVCVSTSAPSPSTTGTGLSPANVRLHKNNSNSSELPEAAISEAISINPSPTHAPIKGIRHKNNYRAIKTVPVFKTPYHPKHTIHTKDVATNCADALNYEHLESSELSENPIVETEAEITPSSIATMKAKNWKYGSGGDPTSKNAYVSNNILIDAWKRVTKPKVTKQRSNSTDLSENHVGAIDIDSDTCSIKQIFLNQSRTKCVPEFKTSHRDMLNASHIDKAGKNRSKVALRKKRSENSELSEDPLGVTDTDINSPKLQLQTKSRKLVMNGGAGIKRGLISKHLATRPSLLTLKSQSSQLSEDPIGDTNTDKISKRTRNKQRNGKFVFNRSHTTRVELPEMGKKTTRKNLLPCPLLRRIDKNMAFFRLQNASQAKGRLARILEKFAPIYANSRSNIRIQKRTLTVTRNITTVRSTLTRVAGGNSNAVENRNGVNSNLMPNIRSPYFAMPSARPAVSKPSQAVTNVPRSTIIVDRPPAIQENLPTTIQSPYFAFSPKGFPHRRRGNHLPQPPPTCTERTLSLTRVAQCVEGQQNLLHNQTYNTTKPSIVAVDSTNIHGRMKHSYISKDQYHEASNHYVWNDKLQWPNCNYFRNLENDPPVDRKNRLNTVINAVLARSNYNNQRESGCKYTETRTKETTNYVCNDRFTESIRNVSRKLCIDPPAARINRFTSTKNKFLTSSDFICSLDKLKNLPRNYNKLRFDNPEFRYFGSNKNCQQSVQEADRWFRGVEAVPLGEKVVRTPLSSSLTRAHIPSPVYSLIESTPITVTCGHPVMPQMPPPPIEKEANSLSYFRRMLSIQRKYHSHPEIHNFDPEQSCSENDQHLDVPNYSPLKTWDSHALFDKTNISRNNKAKLHLQQSVPGKPKEVNLSLTKDFSKRETFFVSRESTRCGPEDLELETTSANESLEWPRWLTPVPEDFVYRKECRRPLVLEFLPDTRHDSRLKGQLKRGAGENVEANAAKIHHSEEYDHDESSHAGSQMVLSDIVSVEDLEGFPLFVDNGASCGIAKDYTGNTIDKNIPSISRSSKPFADSCLEELQTVHSVLETSSDEEIIWKTLETSENQTREAENDFAKFQTSRAVLGSSSDEDIIPDTPQHRVSKIIRTSLISSERSYPATVNENLPYVVEEPIFQHVQEVEEATTKAVPEINQEWVQRVDGEGVVFFVHVRSGMTSFDPPIAPAAQNSFSMTKRYGFLPKGMSPILQKVDDGERTKDLSPGSRAGVRQAVEEAAAGQTELSTIKWRDDQPGCAELIRRMMKDCERKMKFCETAVPDICVQKRDAVKVNNLIMSYTFTKDIFSNIRVLGQLDHKFIVTLLSVEAGGKSPHLLVFFDQHAVHERIRLERLMKDYMEEDSDSRFKSYPLDSPLAVPVTAEESRIISSFPRDFERLGLELATSTPSSVLVTRVPWCLKRRCDEGHVATLDTCVQFLVREQVRALVDSRGVGVRVPSVLQDAVNSEACRGAIKFGDPLSVQACEMLLADLGQCDLPFQCAHGRPSLAPIVDLQSLAGQGEGLLFQPASKPSYWKLKKTN